MGLFGLGKAPVKPLRLIAEEVEDLPAISALLQDAALRLGDMIYEDSGRHFTLRMNRFCHEISKGSPLRAPTVLRINCVTKVQFRGFDMANRMQPISLLDISVDRLEAPACALILRFAGEGAKDLRIEVECLDVLLLDLAAPRRARIAPRHPLD